MHIYDFHAILMVAMGLDQINIQLPSYLARSGECIISVELPNTENMNIL